MNGERSHVRVRGAVIDQHQRGHALPYHKMSPAVWQYCVIEYPALLLSICFVLITQTFLETDS